MISISQPLYNDDLILLNSSCSKLRKKKTIEHYPLVFVYDEQNFGIHQDSEIFFISPGGINESLQESSTCKHRSCRLTGSERQYFTVNWVRQAVEHTIGYRRCSLLSFPKATPAGYYAQ